MKLNLDTGEKFWAITNALDQYVENCWDGADIDLNADEEKEHERAYAEFPYLKAAEEMLEEMNNMLAFIASMGEETSRG